MKDQVIRPNTQRAIIDALGEAEALCWFDCDNIGPGPIRNPHTGKEVGEGWSGTPSTCGCGYAKAYRRMRRIRQRLCVRWDACFAEWDWE